MSQPVVTDANAPSNKIVDRPDVVGLILQNFGAADIYLDSNQQVLDSDIDQVSNTPSNGIILRVGAAPMVIPFFTGQLFARAAASSSISIVIFPVYAQPKNGQRGSQCC